MFEEIINFELETVFRLLLAIALGALIGFERELKHRPAGLRTHMLVSLGATVFTIISLSFDIEPSRIAAGIVTGIGFLGAGSIIAHKGHIRGITSAATLWVVAGIGLSIGVGQYIIAITSSLLVFAILQLGRIENRYDVDEKKM
ncbi:MgtC/SapB family protein [Nitrosopumilus sp.]|uniref:MgtC/SapB family protein n=1 Tax=Nitrosopumilus sp. TaxID=2024843 RepID=UPI00292D8FE9|nr:MgtC/SapB family protein [Nitrosopumilus sp.]